MRNGKIKSGEADRTSFERMMADLAEWLVDHLTATWTRGQLRVYARLQPLIMSIERSQDGAT